MRTRTLYLLLLLAFLPSSLVLAQNTQVHFTYDTNGNRILRSIELKKVEENGKNVEAKNTFLTEVNDQLGVVQLNLYPNPTTGKFTVELSESPINDINILLSTMTGALIEECQFKGLQHDFDLTGQPAGVYLLRIIADDETRTWKIVKH